MADPVSLIAPDTIGFAAKKFATVTGPAVTTVTPDSLEITSA